MKIDEARNNKLIEKMKMSGWSPRSEGLVSNPVRFWLYSVSLETGERLIAQAGSQLHREMFSKEGMVGQIIRSGEHPGDLLSGYLKDFDKQPGSAQDIEAHGLLTVLMAGYAASTKTFESMKPISQVPGCHFFVFDWKIDSGRTTVLKPAGCYADAPLGAKEIAGIMEQAISTHVKNNPGDRPSRW